MTQSITRRLLLQGAAAASLMPAAPALVLAQAAPIRLGPLVPLTGAGPAVVKKPKKPKLGGGRAPKGVPSNWVGFDEGGGKPARRGAGRPTAKPAGKPRGSR